MFQFLKGFGKRKGCLNKTPELLGTLPEGISSTKAPESGRTMLEMLSVLSVMVLVVVGGVAAYRKLALKSESRTITQFIFTHVLERQHEALTSKGKVEHSKTNVAGPHGVYFDIRNIPNRHLIEIIIKSNDIELINSVHSYFRNGYENSPSHPSTYRVHNPSLGGGQYKASLYMTFPQFTEMSRETIQSLNPTCPSGSSVDGLGDFVQNADDDSPCYAYCPDGQYYLNNQCVDCTLVDNYLTDGSGDTDGTVCCPDGYTTAVGGTCCKDTADYCQKVEYLQSSGTQYIESGVYATENSKVVADFQYLSVVSQHHIFGYSKNNNYGTSGSGINMSAYTNGSLYFAYACNYGEIGNWVSSGISADTERHALDFNMKEGYWKLDSIIQTFSTVSGAPGALPMDIFALARDDGREEIETYSDMRLYSMKMFNDETLVRDFIPVLGHSGEACMYNAVAEEGDQKLYCNSGTGTFTVGPVIE